MASAGTAYVDIEARLDSLASEVDAAVANLSPEVEVGAQVDEAQAEIDSLNADPIAVDVGAQVDEAQGEIDSLNADPITVDVDANVEGAQSQIDGLGGSISGLAGDLGGGGGGAAGALDAFSGAALGAGSASSIAATGGIAALAAGLGESVAAAMEAEAAQARLGAVLATTGADAFVTQDSLMGLATEIQNYSGQSDEAIQTSEAFLLTFAGVSNEAAISAGILDRATRATADMAALMGGEASQAALRLGRALDNPAVGLSMLQRSGVSFTDSQKELIQSLYESGDVIGAQSALLDAVEGQLGGVAEAYGGTLGGQLDIAKQKLGDVSEQIGGAMAPSLLVLIDLLDKSAVEFQWWNDKLGGILLDGPLNHLDDFWAGLTGGTIDIAGAGTVIGDLPEALQQVDDAFENVNQSIDDYVNAITGLPGAQRDLQQSFAELSETMGDPASTFNDVAVAQENVVVSTANTIAKQREMGATTAELQGTIRSSIGVLRDMRDQGVITGAQFDTLSGQIRAVPHEATTEVSAPGVDGTLRQLREVKTVIDGIDRNIVVQVSVPNLGAIAADVQGAAAALRSLRRSAPAPDSFALGEAVTDELRRLERAGR